MLVVLFTMFVQFHVAYPLLLNRARFGTLDKTKHGAVGAVMFVCVLNSSKRACSYCMLCLLHVLHVQQLSHGVVVTISILRLCNAYDDMVMLLVGWQHVTMAADADYMPVGMMKGLAQVVVLLASWGGRGAGVLAMKINTRHFIFVFEWRGETAQLQNGGHIALQLPNLHGVAATLHQFCLWVMASCAPVVLYICCT